MTLCILRSLYSFTVPEPTVSLHSDSPNPVLSGSSLTLTCIAELNSMINVSLFVSTTWKRPEGTVITLAGATEMKSFALYSSTHNLPFLQSADSGEYTCTMNFENGVEMSASTNITIGDSIDDQFHVNNYNDLQLMECFN